MGYCNRRTDRFGRPRYTAMFLDTDGKHHSAGTYSTKKEATDAWQAAEAKVKEGQGHHLIRGRVLFRVYVEQDWMPNLTVGTKTRENYSYELYAHIMPFFGEKRMLDIRASEIKRWLTELKEKGVSPASRKYLKALLSTIFSNAVREEIVPGNPCLLVRTEKVPKRHLDIITPAQFDKFYTALADEMWKLLVETAIETGMRWGN
jgi:integrase